MTTAVLEKPKNRKRSARSLRREIRDRLWGTDDPDVLRAVLGFVRSNVPELPELPEELVKQLEEAKRDIAEGRGIPHEEVMARLRQRYGSGTPLEPGIEVPY